MWGSHTKYVAAAQLWWAPPKNPQKIHAQTIQTIYKKASIKNFIWKNFSKNFPKKSKSPTSTP